MFEKANSPIYTNTIAMTNELRLLRSLQTNERKQHYARMYCGQKNKGDKNSKKIQRIFLN